MFYFDEDQHDNGFEVASPLSNSSYRSSALTLAISSTASSPIGVIHNTYCTTKDPVTTTKICHSPFADLTSSKKQPSLFGSTTTTTNVVGDADWRKKDLLQNTCTTTTPSSAYISGKTKEETEQHQQRRSFYLGGDDDSEVEEVETEEEEHSDSDFEDEIESLNDSSTEDEDDRHQAIFALDDDSGIGTISTEPSLEEEMSDRPSELISLPRSIRIGSVGRRGLMRTPRGRKQRLQFTDFYELTDHLGQGAYASVRTAVQKSTKKEFAVKLVNKHEPGHTRSKIMREVEIFKMCKGHQNIVQLIQWFEDDDYYYMVFEKMRGGPLLNHIQAKSCFTEEEASQVTKDIAMALKFLHDKGVAHRDIKPENILCTDPDRVSPVKICDLDLASKPPCRPSRYSSKCGGSDNHGSANAISRSLPVVHSEPDLASPVGSAEFMAPEVVEAFTGDRFKYDKRCDMWALGVVLYVMLCGYPPFFGQCDNEDCKWAQGEACDECQQNLFERIQIGEFDFPDDEGWADISEDAKDLICHLLVKNVRERYTADDVLRHPWIVHEAPQTPLQTVTNLLYRNDSARDITMMNENFNAINRMKAERLANNTLTIEEVDTSSSGSPPSPTTLFPDDQAKSGAGAKQPIFPSYIPVHTPAIIQAQSPYNNGYYVNPIVTQPQLINMNGMMIYAPQMAPAPEYTMASYAHHPQVHGPHSSEIRNGTTYFFPQQHQNHHSDQTNHLAPTSWYSPQLPHHPNHFHQYHHQHEHHAHMQHLNNAISRSLDHPSTATTNLNGAFSQMGLETCQNAMQRQDSKNEIHSKQTRETQVNV
jgi:MAP kinase interacting serine/threonine kinase